MPMMKAPNYPGIIYNGLNINPGGVYDVLPQDVDAHLAAGWEIDRNPPPPVLDVTPNDLDEED